MNAAEIEAKYRQKGLIVEHVSDAPGKIYEPHAHEQTLLFTIRGSVDIKLEEGEWQTLFPGREFVVGSGQLHEARVGEQGWEYVAAWDAEDAKKYAFKHP